MSEEIFRSSDLAAKRTLVLHAARDGGARIRGKDGTFVVAMPEREVSARKEIAHWWAARLRLVALLRRGGIPSLAELGDLAWLRAFDREDLLEFADDLGSALIAAHPDWSFSTATTSSPFCARSATSAAQNRDRCRSQRVSFRVGDSADTDPAPHDARCAAQELPA
ncbi:hypothetical protein [Amycolatopsis sp. NPDC004079]|uniref:hypothetical protein n=1 Tax=Amycolatopsis sp. NPDC004079 TaxID=3154549 RepID=UPI0033A4CAA1